MFSTIHLHLPTFARCSDVWARGQARPDITKSVKQFLQLSPAVVCNHKGLRRSRGGNKLRSCCATASRAPIIGTMNNHKDWFDIITGQATKAEASAKIDIDNSTITHQYRASQLLATTVIGIARTYSVNGIQTLVDTRYIDPDEASIPDTLDVRFFDDRLLVAELARRINSQPAHWDGTFEEVFTRNGVDESNTSRQPCTRIGSRHLS